MGNIENEMENRIKTLRNERGMTQEELAKAVGLNRSTIAGYEKNYIQPSHEMLVKLSTFFNVSVDYLIGASSVRTATINLKTNVYDKLQQVCDALASSNEIYFKSKVLSENERYIVYKIIQGNIAILNEILIRD